MTEIRILRAAGLSDTQIVAILELEQTERMTARREQNRINKKNQRSRQHVSADRADRADRADNADNADRVSPPSPPSMVSPNTPFLTTPSPTPSSFIRTTFEEFWAIYPKRDGANPKAPALKKFSAIVRSGTEAAVIISGARGYASAESDRAGTPYIAQAVTWLNQSRWQDYAAPVPIATGPPVPPREGLPTHEQLRAKYATNTDDRHSSVLEEGEGSCDSERGVGRRETGQRGTRSLGTVFSGMAALDAVVHEANGRESVAGDFNASAVAGMVRR
jgi:hypothetical protein